jgi:hypothetical protein
VLAGMVRRDADIHGHRCVAYKDCPAGKMWPLMDDLKRLVAKYVTTGFKTTTAQEDDMPYTPDQIKVFAGQGVHGQRIGKSATTIGMALEEILKDVREMRAEIAELKAAKE